MTTKKELIDAVHDVVPAATKAQIQSIFEAAFVAIKAELKKDGKFTQSGFGTFEIRERSARVGQHPKTGDKIEIPASKTVTFRPSPTLKKTLNK